MSPMLARHPRKRATHATHARKPPTQACHPCHPRWHATHATHASTNSTPFHKLDFQKPCSIVLRFVITNHMYLYCRLAHLTGVFKNQVNLVLYILLHLIRRISNYICKILFICNQQTSEIKPVNIQSRSPRKLIKRTSTVLEVSIYPKP